MDGEVAQDVFPDAPTITTNATESSPVGDYVTTVNYTTVGSNYTVKSRTGVLKVIPIDKLYISELIYSITQPELQYNYLKENGELVNSYEENYLTRVLVYEYLFTEFIVRTQGGKAISFNPPATSILL